MLYKLISYLFCTCQRAFHSSRNNFSSKDPYATLGVKKDASQSDVKKAYYSLAKKFHPDVNKDSGAKERYQDIQEAYDILGDEQKRTTYDRFGPISQQPGFDPNAFSSGSGGFGAGGSPFGDMFGGDASDVFSSLFGAFGGRAGGSRGGQQNQVFVGEDLEVSITIPFTEMAKGTNRKVTINPIVDCPTCEGSGTKNGAKPQTCKACNGTGTVTFMVQSGFTMASTCQSCGGSGTKIADKDLCASCGGVGKVRDRKDVPVKIPAGVEDGMKIKILGQGNAAVGGGKNSRPGDLYVRVNVTPSRIFRRQGSNIYTEIKIPFHIALLGGTVRVPTLEKEVEVQVPRGTQPGEELVLKGRGVKHLYKEWLGDLIVKFNVALPRSLTPEQREAMESYVAATEGTRTESVRKTESSSVDSEKSSKLTIILCFDSFWFFFNYLSFLLARP
ncbi:hypothetical protein BY996DRAFT_4582357 [Phakopsora pachyrhizi]|nr:hypothetical protein BY996DRAFT_4582357 [Phakopsora pachyrhizi]